VVDHRWDTAMSILPTLDSHYSNVVAIDRTTSDRALQVRALYGKALAGAGQPLEGLNCLQLARSGMEAAGTIATFPLVDQWILEVTTELGSVRGAKSPPDGLNRAIVKRGAWVCPSCSNLNPATGTCESCGRILSPGERRWVRRGRNLADYQPTSTTNVLASCTVLAAAATVVLIALASVPGYFLIAAGPPATPAPVKPNGCLDRTGCPEAVLAGTTDSISSSLFGPSPVTYLWVIGSPSLIPNSFLITSGTSQTLLVRSASHKGIWRADIGGATSATYVAASTNNQRTVIPVHGLSLGPKWVLRSGAETWIGSSTSRAGRSSPWQPPVLLVIGASVALGLLTSLIAKRRTTTLLARAFGLALAALVLGIFARSLCQHAVSNLSLDPPHSPGFSYALLVVVPLALVVASGWSASLARKVSDRILGPFGDDSSAPLRITAGLLTMVVWPLIVAQAYAATWELFPR
jgi:hypothetical protein